MPWNPNTPGSTSQSDNQGSAAPTPMVLQASTTVTTTGNQAQGVDVGGVTDFGLELNVTAASGTSPTLVVHAQWSNDNVNWGVADPTDSFASLNTVSRRFRAVDVKARYMRIAWTVGGTTPSFTFTVTGLAQY